MTVGKITPKTAHTEPFAISRLHLPGPAINQIGKRKEKQRKVLHTVNGFYGICLRGWLGEGGATGACNSLDISMLLLLLNARTYNGRKF